MGWQNLELIEQEDSKSLDVIRDLCKEAGCNLNFISTVVPVGQMVKSRFVNDLRICLEDDDAWVVKIPKIVKGKLNGYVYVAVDSKNEGRVAVARLNFDG